LQKLDKGKIMDWKQNRLLELAGIKRRRTPDHILFEGDDEGGDDPFADDGGDDEGGDDLFGDDEGDEGDEGGDDDAGGDTGGSEEGGNRIPPENLKPDDIKKFGSPRFLDVETKVSNMFNSAFVSASVGAQELEAYPGNAMKEVEPTPAKEEEPEEDEKKDKNESFYRFGNKRDKWLIREASRLLTEAETEGAAADEFDMESFCNELANYMDNIHNTEDIEAGIFNMGRQMILNNFGQDTETEFINMLASVSGDKYSFLQTGFEGGNDTPVAVGATDGGGA
tara:strand:+ start:673 stop:1515 length:843 start_codon:yes stop_codon:yes gene_type:complete